MRRFSKRAGLAFRNGTAPAAPLALLLALLGGCGKQEPNSESKGGSQAPKTQVTLVRPERTDFRHSLSRPGYIEAFEETRMFAKLAGYVRKVNADIGTEFKEGDVLAEIGIPEMEVELVQKDSLVLQAKANLGSAQAKAKAVATGIIRAKAEVKRWTLEQRRQERMVRQGTLDQQSLDVAVAQLEASRAAQAEAEAEAVKANADVEVAKRNIQVAQANKDYVAALLQYTKVVAPYKGVVVKRPVNTGDFVQPAAGSASRAEALFVVARTDQGVRIFVDVPEAVATSVNAETRATVRVRALPGLEVEGDVTRSAWALDPNARTLRTEIDIKNPGKLRPGMYAYVTLTTLHKNVWTLPASAVVTKDNEVFCFRVEKGKAVKVFLRIGLNNGHRVEVLKKLPKRAKPGEKEQWEDITGKEAIVQGDADKLINGEEVSVASSKR
jgi:multidrug efflux pump subunit AcrA (membrane-fusion protein)